MNRIARHRKPSGARRGAPDRTCRLVAVLAGLVLALSQPVRGDTIRIKGVDYIGDLPTHIVDRDARLDRLDIEIEYDSSGAQNLAELRSGQIHFALMAMTPLVVDALADPDPGQPDDPVILANLSHAQPLLHILSIASGGDTSPTSLYGQRLGVQRATNAHYIWSLFVKAHGLDPDRIEVVYMNSSDIPAAMAAGQVDAAVLWEPWSSEIAAAHPGEVTEFPSEGLYVSRWMLVSRPDVIAADPARTDAVLRAYIDAVRWIQGNPVLAAREIAVRWPLWNVDADDLGESLLFQVSLDWSLFRSFRQQLVWARESGAFGAGQGDPVFLDIIAPAPLERVAPSNVRLPRGLSRGAQDRP